MHTDTSLLFILFSFFSFIPIIFIFIISSCYFFFHPCSLFRPKLSYQHQNFSPSISSKLDLSLYHQNNIFMISSQKSYLHHKFDAPHSFDALGGRSLRPAPGPPLDIANQPVTKQDAATMQIAENMVIGKVQKGGPAAVMQSAADVNVSRGVVGREDKGIVAGDKGVAISDAEVGGHHVITESICGEVLGQYVRPDTKSSPTPAPATKSGDDQVTIGEALEAAAISAGEKPIEQSDAAAIQAAEVRATGRMQITPGGVAAKAQAAVSQNARTLRDEDKTKLGDVLADASTMLPKDKVVTREDAEGVIGAEIRNQPDLATYPGGVAATMAAAARLNQKQ